MIFFLLNGNNGSTYILNTKAITASLNFYQARTKKQKIQKNFLKIYLKLLALFNSHKLKNKKEVNLLLDTLCSQSIDFNVDDNCSILVSPTRDKVIVHHHGDCFHKFAFGNSYKNVRNEAEIYKLLNKPLQSFHISKLYDFQDDGTVCSFKLANQHEKKEENIDLTSALVDLFNCSRQENVPFVDYLESVKAKLNSSAVACKEFAIQMLEKFGEAYKKKQIPLGLTHRDFKHWNINTDAGLLIYDFEEAVTDGPPLEDLFNYHIDPVVRYLPPSKVSQIIFRAENIQEYKRYLNKLDIDMDFKPLLYAYLIERSLFWMERDDEVASEKYCILLEHIAKMDEK